MERERILKLRYNPCQACREGLLHTKEEWRKYHPDAGKGLDKIGDKQVRKERDEQVK